MVKRLGTVAGVSQRVKGIRPSVLVACQDGDAIKGERGQAG